MVEIYKSIKESINRYIDIIKSQIMKEELMLRKEPKMKKRFILNLCVLINTIDYIKETINKMNDVIFNLIDEPYNQNLDFMTEEDKCAKICIELINSIMKLYDVNLESIFTDSMIKLPWDKIQNVNAVNHYTGLIKELIDFFAMSVKDNINNVYLIRCFKMLSEITNNRFLESVYKIRRINELSVQQLRIGKVNRFYWDKAETDQYRPQQQQRTDF